MTSNSSTELLNSLPETLPNAEAVLLEEANSGSISGIKWNDIDGDGERDIGEPGLEGWTIYLDANDNGELDAGEMSTVTDEDGNYSFTNLPIGTYTVAEQLQPNWQPTNPVGVPGQIVQLTNNNLNESHPRISGQNIVWQANDGNDTEIYFYDGSQVVQLTDNNEEDSLPQISGNHIVWQGSDGNDTEIYLYDGTQIVPLTDNQTNDANPQISGNHIVWQGSDGNDTEIYSYKSSQVVQLTDNEVNDFRPLVSGNNIVWAHQIGSSDPTFYDLYFYNGSQVIAITDNGPEPTTTYGFDISGDTVIWEENAGYLSTYLKLYNSDNVPTLGGGQYNTNPKISGNKVVWKTHDDNGENNQLYFYNGSERIPLHIADPSLISVHYEYQISGNKVVWQVDDEMYLYDGDKIVTLTNNNFSDSDPQIDGNTLAWLGNDGNDTEIYTVSLKNAHTVTLNPGETITDLNFGNHQLSTNSAEIRGLKWNDSNCNGTFDSGETGLSGWTIYLDANTNGILDEGEVSTTTATDGSYAFTDLEPGTYTVAEVPQTGWEQTAPISGSHTVEIEASEMVENLNFGNRQSVFNGTKNADNLTGTICADTLNGRAGNDTLQGLDDNDFLNGQAGNDVLFGDKGNDLLQGNIGDDVVVGGEGNDSLFGGNGLDTLIGVDASATQPGVGEIDHLRGNADADRFVLGDALNSYYNDGKNTKTGVSDYGLIKDFVVGEDVIQLSGSASDYFLATSPSKLPSGTAIFLETGTTDELIGIVRNVPLAQLDLNSSSFSYV